MSEDVSRYRILDHTGDLAILVRADTLPDLYDAATYALFDVILDVGAVEARESLPLRIDGAADAEDLLVRFLSELLFLHDARHWLFRGARVRAIGHDSVDAEVLGERFDPARHRVKRQIKAVTYHALLLSQDAQGWSARVVLDL